MEKCSGIDAVHNFWEQVWQSPQNYDAIDDLVVEDFVFISGGRRIEGREAFKKWVEDFSGAIGNLLMQFLSGGGGPGRQPDREGRLPALVHL